MDGRFFVPQAGRSGGAIINPGVTIGIPTVLLTVVFFAGVQLVILGAIGEYLGRLYQEVKRRPLYLVDEVLED